MKKKIITSLAALSFLVPAISLAATSPTNMLVPGFEESVTDYSSKTERNESKYDSDVMNVWGKLKELGTNGFDCSYVDNDGKKVIFVQDPRVSDELVLSVEYGQSQLVIVDKGLDGMDYKDRVEFITKTPSHKKEKKDETNVRSEQFIYLKPELRKQITDEYNSRLVGAVEKIQEAYDENQSMKKEEYLDKRKMFENDVSDFLGGS